VTNTFKARAGVFPLRGKTAHCERYNRPVAHRIRKLDCLSLMKHNFRLRLIAMQTQPQLNPCRNALMRPSIPVPYLGAQASLLSSFVGKAGWRVSAAFNG
jgi:hypothetical protein